MTYSGTMLKDLTIRTAEIQDRSEKLQSESAKHSEFRFENNSALRAYLIKIVGRILDKAAEPTDPALEHQQFLAEVNQKWGMTKAAEPTDPALEHQQFLAEVNQKWGMTKAAELINQEVDELVQ